MARDCLISCYRYVSISLYMHECIVVEVPCSTASGQVRQHQVLIGQ